MPKDGRGKPGLFAQYVYMSTGSRLGWYLNIPATDWTDRALPSMGIETDSLLVEQNSTYSLKKQKGFASISYSQGENQFNITPFDTGSLTITKHDQALRILAGRFSFTASSGGGEKISVTEGRFDIRY